MKTIKTLLLVASLGLVAGCSNNTPQEPVAGPQRSPGSTTAVVAVKRSPTDVTPSRIFQRPSLPVVRDLVQVSTAVSPVDKISAETDAIADVKSSDVFKLIPEGTTETTHTIQVDSTDGEAHLFLLPRSADAAAIKTALKGIEVFDPDGVRVNARAPKIGMPADDEHPMSALPLAGHPAGTYTVKMISAAAKKTGLALDVRQPASKLVMTLSPSATQQLLGSDGHVDIKLEDQGSPVTGATLEARLSLPDGKQGPTVNVEDLGGGLYRARVLEPLSADHPAGAYMLDVKAAGKTASGRSFARTGQAGFHYGVPSARIANVSEPRSILNDQGQVDAFEIEVDVESASLDRLELSATLAAKAPDGEEHPVAVAHVGAGLDAGSHKLTLRFDAGHAKLTRLDGTYLVRNVKLFSLGTNTLFHRVAFHPGQIQGIRRDALAAPKQITPAMQQMIDDGVLGD
jgi:hypothetical protein